MTNLSWVWPYIRLPKFMNEGQSEFIWATKSYAFQTSGAKVTDQTAKLFQSSPTLKQRATRYFWSFSKFFFCPFGTQRHSSVAAKVTNLLVWVQQIRFRKQSGAASQPKCVLKPRRRTVCAPVNLLILRPAAGLRSLGLIWNDIPVFSLWEKYKIWPNRLPTKKPCVLPVLS